MFQGCQLTVEFYQHVRYVRDTSLKSSSYAHMSADSVLFELPLDYHSVRNQDRMIPVRKATSRPTTFYPFVHTDGPFQESQEKISQKPLLAYKTFCEGHRTVSRPSGLWTYLYVLP